MSQGPINEARFQRLCVMIVEDSQPMREVLRAILQSIGVKNIIDARDGNHAIRKLGEYQVDVIITDWVMEEMDGVELTRWIRTSEHSPDEFLPIIMVSGYTESNRIEMARDAGVTEFMAKPFTGVGLIQRLVAVIEHPRPFVRTDDYFGPDRRRKVEPFDGEERREAEIRNRDARAKSAAREPSHAGS
ncbi:response regulator [Nisaea acidiphila]|uniref:Response regulator n=1 Tax=Nisaea acidiphila TaxID=1862145 RepID=A0A9J7ANK0_9PROT|nr:response regulator [Nisaea acidiphila]UUX48767.1 response regulator [Nisaea acidiphila]